MVLQSFELDLNQNRVPSGKNEGFEKQTDVVQHFLLICMSDKMDATLLIKKWIYIYFFLQD